VRFGRLPDGGTIVTADADGDGVDVDQVLADFARQDTASARTIRDLLPARGCSWTSLIDGWDRARDPLATLLSWAGREGRTTAFSQAAPAPLASAAVGIFAIGANFASHAARSQFAMEGGGAAVDARVAALLESRRQGAPPWGFSILARTVAGPGQPIGRPAGARLLDYEGEVGAVLRRDPAGGISLWGLAAFHDVSVRDPHFKIGPRIDEGPITWVLQKNFRGGSALGPCVVVDEDLDVSALGIVTRVNGEVRQRGTTSEMVYGFGDVVDYLGRCIPLLSGDVIASGTPAGTAFESGLDGAYLQDGDVVEIAVEGVGVLVNRVMPFAEQATWQQRAAGIGAP
jgi:2-keto-4-pentenoate hydratase/2-oxohepta-3-ene-1,7-dioic acid hydratase in catechol pathway